MILDANDERPRPRGNAREAEVVPRGEDKTGELDEAHERPKRSRAKKQESAPKQSPPWKLLGWCLAGVIGLLLFLWIGTRVDEFLTTDPRCALAPAAEVGEPSPNLQITGVKRANREEILKIFAADLGRSIYLVPLAERRSRLTQVDWIRDASVLRIWPNRIQVHLTERVAVARQRRPTRASASRRRRPRCSRPCVRRCPSRISRHHAGLARPRREGGPRCTAHTRLPGRD